MLIAPDSKLSGSACGVLPNDTVLIAIEIPFANENQRSAAIVARNQKGAKTARTEHTTQGASLVSNKLEGE